MTPEATARARLRVLAANLRRAAKHPGKAESVHHLRVSIRRFRQVLRVFGGLFRHTRKMRRSLRGLMDLCGVARNCDIALEVLDQAGVPASAALEKRLKQRRSRAGRELGKLLDKGTIRGTIRAGMRRWREWLTSKSGRPVESARTVLASLNREFLAAGAAAAKAGAAFDQMHAFRLLVKRYRYTLEILGRPPMETLRGLQECLGAINDCVTTAELVDDLDLSAAEKRKINAAVDRLLTRRAADFRAYWRKSRRRK
jgi:CHAD domain-containing protein